MLEQKRNRDGTMRKRKCDIEILRMFHRGLLMPFPFLSFPLL
jgi:hypothetical protein